MLKNSLLLALLATALPAQATSINVLANYTIDNNGSYTASDNGGIPGHVGALVQPAWVPADDIIINTAVPFGAISGDYYPIGQAQANGNAAGDIAVQAGFLAPGRGTVDTLHARTTWSDTVVNNSGSDQAYTFNFHILPGGILAGADAAGTWQGGGMQANYIIQIMLDNNVIWNSAASLQVGKDSGGWQHILTLSGTELGRTYSESLTYGDCAGYNNCAGYTFDGYNGLLDLGSFANNTSHTLSYLMDVSVAGPIVETGAYAAFGDPLNLTGGMNGQLNLVGGPTPAPEPATLLLLGLGLAGLGWARRRG